VASTAPVRSPFWNENVPLGGRGLCLGLINISSVFCTRIYEFPILIIFPYWGNLQVSVSSQTCQNANLLNWESTKQREPNRDLNCNVHPHGIRTKAQADSNFRSDINKHLQWHKYYIYSRAGKYMCLYAVQTPERHRHFATSPHRRVGSRLSVFSFQLAGGTGHVRWTGC